MFQAVILGIVQGATEFLPVSSSGHLVLAHQLFSFTDLDPAFDVFVQGGTVISLIAYFAPRLRSLKLTPGYLWQLLIGCLPAVIAGLLLGNQIESMFGTLSGISLGFFLTTAFLILGKYVKAGDSKLTSGKSLLIGLSQAAAIFPSLSRSGATVSTALMLGVEREQAFNYSFLMSIPLLIGASALSARDLVWQSGMSTVYLTGFFVAAIVGYLSLLVLGKLISQGKFHYFAPYTLILAILTLFLT